MTGWAVKRQKDGEIKTRPSQLRFQAWAWRGLGTRVHENTNVDDEDETTKSKKKNCTELSDMARTLNPGARPASERFQE